MTMSVAQTLVMAVALVALLRVAMGYFRGAKRGATRSGIRLGLVALSVLGAFLLTRSMVNHVGPMLETMADKYLLGDLPQAADQAIDASSSLLHYVLDLILSLFAPVLFWAVFGILRFVTWIIYLIVCRFLPSDVDEKGKREFSRSSRITGGALSCVAALLLVFAILTPAVGYASFAAEAYPTMVEKELVKEESLPPSLVKNMEGLGNSTTLNVMGAMGMKGLFGSLTVMEDGETRATLEAFVLMELVPGISGVTKIQFGDTFKGEGILDMSPMDEGLIPVLSKSPHLCDIVAEIMSTAATKWLAGEEFLGINLKSQIPAEYSTSLDAALELVSRTDASRVAADLKTLSKTLVLVSRSYTYMNMVEDYVNVTGEHLQTEMETILESVDHDSAGLLASALSDEFVSTAKLNDDGVEVVQTMVSHVLDDVADLEGEQKKREAAAINTLIMYASTSRQEEISATSLVNTIMSSQLVRASIEEQTTPNPQTGTYKTVEVRADQKAALDQAIANYAKTATPEELESLAALQSLFVGPQP